MAAEFASSVVMDGLMGWKGATSPTRARLLEALCVGVRTTSLISNSLTLVLLAGLIIAQTHDPVHAAWVAAVILGGALPRVYAAKLRRIGRYDKDAERKALGFLVVNAVYGLIWGAGPFLVLPEVERHGYRDFPVYHGLRDHHGALRDHAGNSLCTPGHHRDFHPGSGGIVYPASGGHGLPRRKCLAGAAYGCLAGILAPCAGNTNCRIRWKRATQRWKRRTRAMWKPTGGYATWRNGPLTGAFNRRELMQRLSGLDGPAALVLFDIDHFKAVNDNFGHHVGDVVLIKLVGLVQGILREHDVLARLGGEELAVVLGDADEESAWMLAERFGAG